MQPPLKRDNHTSTHATYYRFRKYKCRSLKVSVLHSERITFCQTRGDKIAPYSYSFHTSKSIKNLKYPSIIKVRGHSGVCRLYTPANYADSLNTELKMRNEDDAKRAAEKEAAAKAAAEEERKRQARADVTKGLLDKTTVKQLSSSRDDARRRRGK